MEILAIEGILLTADLLLFYSNWNVLYSVVTLLFCRLYIMQPSAMFKATVSDVLIEISDLI